MDRNAKFAIIFAVTIMVAIASFASGSFEQDINTPCEAEWLDMNGVTHCGHHMEYVKRVSDTTGTSRADLFNCFTDQQKVYLPIPRTFIANTIE